MHKTAPEQVQNCQRRHESEDHLQEGRNRENLETAQRAWHRKLSF